jgi:hypothetical protein|nr:MAG TPA: portal protein [Caudoviricetes sp.]
MNKFLNRNVIPSRKIDIPRKQRREEKHLDILDEFSKYWASLDEARRKMRRSVMYAYEDQWGDYIKDPETDLMIREADLIKKNGKVPLKNNMISPILKNIDGQFRNNLTQSICTVRDQKEAKIGEMMSIAVEYVHDLNEIRELDSDSLRLMLCGGFVGQRVEYGWNPAKRMNDVWVYGCNPARMFFNTNIEDVRTWDLNCIGEVYDMPRDKVVALFAKSRADKEWIENIYRTSDTYLTYDGLQGRETKDLDFYTPSRPDLCRVIFGWRLESREAYFCHDTLKGTFFYVGLDEKAEIDSENRRRRNEAMAYGVLPEDILLIEYEYGNEQYWYYRYMSPWGDILQEGRSPYWHGSHNYAFHIYPMVQGKVFNYVEDFIDQQRAINRTMTLIDFIRSSSSKGVLIVDESAFDNMTREEIIDEYVRYNGVLFCNLKNGQNLNNVVQQYNGQAAVAGDYELLNLQLKLINDISGVNSAMQGKQPNAGTAASLYAQQVQNSSLNLKGMFESFNSFRKRRDYKVMQTIQQYYTSARHIDLSGRDYSEEAKYYDPDKVQNAQIDLKITEGTNTPSFQMLQNDFLMQLFERNAIDVKILLENCSYPFAVKILEAVKRNEQAMMSQQAMGGIPQDMMPSGNSFMQKVANDRFAAPEDGIVRVAS